MGPRTEGEGSSLCAIELEPTKAAVKLKVTHTIERDVSKVIAAVSDAWPKILSNLKSLVESGSTVL